MLDDTHNFATVKLKLKPLENILITIKTHLL